MSRIGKLPITVPGGVTITVGDGNTVTVKGPKGTLTEKISPAMELSEENGVLTVKRPSDSKEHRAPARPHPFPRSQHGRRRDRGLLEEP